MATPAQFIEQESAQRHQNAAQQKETLDLLQKQFLAKQYEQYANNIPLPDAKSDPESYKKALDLRAKALDAAQKVFAPDHHATLGEHLHGLIFGQKPPQNSPVPVSAAAPTLQPAGATPPAASQPAAPAPPPDHPFAHHPGYQTILDGLKGLESRLKGAVNPNPQEKQPLPNLADFAGVPTTEDLAREAEATKQRDAVALEKLRADATIEAAKIRANASNTSTPEKAFLNRFAQSQGADDYASLTPEQQTEAVMAWKKANAGPVHMQLRPINGWLEQYNPVTGEFKKIVKLDQVTTHSGIHYITNALTGEITAVPYTTYTRKDTGQPIEAEGDTGTPKSSEAPTLPTSTPPPASEKQKTTAPVSSKAPHLASVNAKVATAKVGSKKLNKGKPVSTKAPKLPGLPAGARVVGHTASLLDKSDAAQYTKVAEDANNKKEAYTSAKSALVNPTASSDQELIYSWVRSNVQGAGRMTQAEFRQAAAVGSLPQRAQIWYERTKTGKLPPSIEQMMFADIKRAYDTAETEAKDLRSRLGGSNPVPTPAPQPGSGKSIWDSLPSVPQ